MDDKVNDYAELVPACYATFLNGKIEYSEMCVSGNRGDFDVSDYPDGVDIVALYSEDAIAALQARNAELATENKALLSGPVAPVMAELAKAIAKFPTWPTDPFHALCVLTEEYGELGKAVLQYTYEPHKSSADDIRAEAIQTAAMALRWVASLDAYEYKRCDQHQQAMLTASASEQERKVILPKEWYEKKIAEVGDPEGCPHCGAIAGCCPQYPNCPAGERSDERKV